MLGKVGDGFVQSIKVLDGGRISIAALSLGIAQGAYEAAFQYSKERHQFNQPISNFQGISFKLADMATEIEARSLLTYRAADMKDRGLNVNLESAMAKLYASEVSVRVANEGVQILAATATPRTTRPRSITATPSSAPSAKARPKFRNWLLPGPFSNKSPMVMKMITQIRSGKGFKPRKK